MGADTRGAAAIYASRLAEFEKYKQIPEYQLVNLGMSMAEFKFIYWWEWGHRFLDVLSAWYSLFRLSFFGAKKSAAANYRPCNPVCVGRSARFYGLVYGGQRLH